MMRKLASAKSQRINKEILVKHFKYLTFETMYGRKVKLRFFFIIINNYFKH